MPTTVIDVRAMQVSQRTVIQVKENKCHGKQAKERSRKQIRSKAEALHSGWSSFWQYLVSASCWEGGLWCLTAV